MRNFGDMIVSDDSEEEESAMKLEKKGFGKRNAKKADRDAEAELDLSNLHQQSRKKKQALLASPGAFPTNPTKPPKKWSIGKIFPPILTTLPPFTK